MAFAAAACIALVGYNNLAGVRPWHRRWYPAVNALAVTGMLAAAAASGLTTTDLGPRRDRLRSGLRLGSAAATLVVAAFGLAALTPATRPLLNDQRVAGLDRRQLAYHVLLRIPIGTVAWEEIAFRGVLRAALRRVLAEPAATAVASAVFGIWHIRGRGRVGPLQQPVGDRLIAPPQRLDEPRSALVPRPNRAEQPQRGLLLTVSVGQQHGGPQPARFLVHALQRAGHHGLLVELIRLGAPAHAYWGLHKLRRRLRGCSRPVRRGSPTPPNHLEAIGAAPSSSGRQERHRSPAASPRRRR